MLTICKNHKPIDCLPSSRPIKFSDVSRQICDPKGKKIQTHLLDNATHRFLLSRTSNSLHPLTFFNLVLNFSYLAVHEEYDRKWSYNFKKDQRNTHDHAKSVDVVSPLTRYIIWTRSTSNRITCYPAASTYWIEILCHCKNDGKCAGYGPRNDVNVLFNPFVLRLVEIVSNAQESLKAQ